jgi:pantothenate synthetase
VLAVRDALSRGKVVSGPAARENDGLAKSQRGESHKSGAAQETRSDEREWVERR